jgi:hypothetical protein
MGGWEIFGDKRMKIPKWHNYKEQKCTIGLHVWSVARLIELSKDLPIMTVPLDHLDLWHTYERLTMREIVMHMDAVNNADLSKPIIMDEDGSIMDGRHRMMKAMLIGDPTIKAVRFDENPPPCSVNED